MEQKKFSGLFSASGTSISSKKPFSAALAFDSAKFEEYRKKLNGLFEECGPLKSSVNFRSVRNFASPLSAGIDMNTWDVKMTIREGLEFKPSPKLTVFLDTFGIADPIEKLIIDTGRHEIGHWEYARGDGFGCPYDKFRHYAAIIEPVHDELVASGKISKGNCNDKAARLANSVEDIIDNHNVNRALIDSGHDYSGMVLFWWLQGQEHGKYGDEYSLYVRLCLKVIGDERYGRLLEGFMSKNKKVDEAAARLAGLFKPEYMDNPENWSALARAYAREAAAFIDEMKETPHQSSPDDSPTSSDGGGGGKGGSGSGSGGGQGGKSDSASGGNGSGAGQGGSSSGGGGLGGKLTPDDISTIMGSRNPGQGVPFYMNTEDAVDGYYRSLAKRIPLSASGKLPSANMSIVPVSYTKFDADSHSEEDLSANKLIFDPLKKSLERAAVSMKFPIELPLQKEKKKMPEFFFTLMDTSGSMLSKTGNTSMVPWGDESYYHSGLLAFYGLMRFFESNGLMHRIKFSGAIFSDETIGAGSIAELKHILLNPLTGGTKIDMGRVVERLADTDNAVFGMISDGDIYNWKEIRDDFIRIAKQNQFFMIQIGYESEASKDLRNAGLPVYFVSSHKDVAKLAIKLAAERYQKAITSQYENEKEKYNLR